MYIHVQAYQSIKKFICRLCETSKNIYVIGCFLFRMRSLNSQIRIFEKSSLGIVSRWREIFIQNDPLCFMVLTDFSHLYTVARLREWDVFIPEHVHTNLWIPLTLRIFCLSMTHNYHNIRSVFMFTQAHAIVYFLVSMTARDLKIIITTFRP